MHKLTKLKFYLKHKNKNLPKFAQNISLQSYSQIHAHDTRGNQRLCLPKISHRFAQNALVFAIPECINSFPDCIIDKVTTHSLQGYSNYIKNYFISGYQDICSATPCYVCNRL